MISPQLQFHVYLFMFEVHYCDTHLCNMLQIDVAVRIYVYLLTARTQFSQSFRQFSELFTSVDISAGIFAPSEGQH
jgi:hypothetical protein